MTDVDRRRLFNQGERAALWASSGGRCANCGVSLGASWQADHRQPWSRGGPTDVTNGDSLCAECNRIKGARTAADGLQPWGLDLREWSDKAFQDWTKKNRPDYLMVATPGAGKTITALRMAHHALESGAVERLLVVVPTDHLRRQWRNAAAMPGIGLHLAADITNAQGFASSDYHGEVVTYQSVASNALVHRTRCRRPTMVIFDEVHHAGDNLPWGSSLKSAFEPAVCRLAMSGTPFRSDDHRIPFVAYEEHDGHDIGRADFSYTYAEAIVDGVCREVLFSGYDGTLEWWSGGDHTRTATFRDPLPRDERSKRKRTALDPNGEWLPQLIRDADHRLSEVRADGHPDAGGLIVCSDQNAAKAIAPLVEQVTGEMPIVAISEDPLASEKIDAFGRSNRRWILAVKMISEGVDIPRLRVGVYATTVSEELTFRQIVGRFVRCQPGIEDQSAHFFMPDDDELIAFAEAIRVEREHALDLIVDRCLDTTRNGTSNQESFFIPITADDAKETRVLLGDDQVVPAELDRVSELALECGIHLSATVKAQVALIMRADGRGRAQVLPRPPAGGSPLTVDQERASMRKVRDKLSKKFGARYGEVLGLESKTAHYRVQVRLLKIAGNPVVDATLEQLRAQVALVKSWLDGLRDGGVQWAYEWDEGGHDGQ